MASLLTNKATGQRTLQFTVARQRKTLHLGKCSHRTAMQVKSLVEAMTYAAFHGEPLDDSAASKLARLGDELLGRIARTGLCAPRAATVTHTVADVVAEFCKLRKDAKDSTRAIWKQAFGSLEAARGGGFDLAAFNAGHADDWRQAQIGAGLREATVRKRTKTIGMLFNWAQRRGYVTGNPFDHLPAANVEGRDKPYVPADIVLKVIDHLPSPAWKVLLALSRFAGLRSPSETRALRWQHVNWSEGRITVPVPKLAHIPGKETRIIPIFTELHPWLLAAFEAAEPGDDRVVALPSYSGTYLRKVIQAAIVKAAVPSWASTFHSLRASCEIDLAAVYPLHVVVGWIGHDMKVAQRSYLKILDRNFADAAGGRAAKCAAPALQNVTHGSPATARNNATKSTLKAGVAVASAGGCGEAAGICEHAQWAGRDQNQNDPSKQKRDRERAALQNALHSDPRLVRWLLS